MLYQKRYEQYIFKRLLEKIDFKIVKNSNCQVRSSNDAKDERIIFWFQTNLLISFRLV